MEPEFDVQTFVAQSVEGMKLATTAHCATWHLDEAENWSVNQTDGRIVFCLPDNIIATAPVQIVGTSNSEDGSFLWGWDHPSVISPLAEHARLVRSFGEKYVVPQYITQKVACNEDQAWEFVALAMRLGRANGTYRGRASPTAHVWMTFGQIDLRKDKGAILSEPK
jgi:hypothetical protein